MKKFLLANWIILVIGILLMSSMVMAIRNNAIIHKNHERQQQAELIRQRAGEILSRTMHGLDLGVRGYALNKDAAMLRPYDEAISTNLTTFLQLDSLLERQGYPHRDQLIGVKAALENYIHFCKAMVDETAKGNMDQFTRMIRRDKGYEVWKKFNAFAEPLFVYEAKVNQEARISYQSAMRINLVMQVSILVLALPLLYLFIVQLRRERDGRSALLKKVKDNDKQFVFNSGIRTDYSAEEVNDTSIQNVTQASRFVSSLAEGNYNIEWKGLDSVNERLNQATLAGNLVRLRNKLKYLKEEDEKRNWINEGISAFSELVRIHQQDVKEMSDQCVQYLSKYVNAQQAGLFLLQEEADEKYLKLTSCYAFNRKKFIQKRINMGEGLVGQSYLEGDIVQLKKLPDGYTHITSGLGQAMPGYMAIVPFKTETKIPAILELFSFHSLEHYQLQFLTKAGEVMASAIVQSQTTSRMKQLLELSAIHVSRQN